MNKWILILWMSLLSSVLLAHQPDISSTILAQQKDKSWILQIRSPLSSFEYEIKNKYGSNSFANPEEFKDLESGNTHPTFKLGVFDHLNSKTPC